MGRPGFASLILACLSLSIAACGGSAPAAGPSPAVGGATTGPITAGDLRTRLYIYADDSMQGREAGKIGNYRATTYIAAEAQRMGLEPAGENGTWFQVLPLINRQIDPASQMASGGTRFEIWKDYAPLPPIQGIPVSLGGTLKGVAVVFGGRMGDSVGILNPDDAAGKVVVFAPILKDGKPVFNFSIGTVLRYQRAAAVAVANWDLAPPPVVGFLHGSGDEVDEPKPATEPAHPLGLFITAAVAEKLFGGPMDQLKPGASGGTLDGMIGYQNKPPAAEARNVVAILRGSDPVLKGEFVAIGAHNDHIGMEEQPVDADSIWAFNKVMRPNGAEDDPGDPDSLQAGRLRAMMDSLRKVHPRARMDSVYNGADDDGSGTVSVLEIAQAFAASKVRPRRSILFVWHTGEEKGLWGSEWFTRHSTVPRDSLVAQLNIDMIGRGDAGDIKGGGPAYLQLIGSRRLSTELGDLVETTNRSGNHRFAFDYSFDADGHPANIYCRSDHAMYARFGIPIVFFTTGGHSDYHMLSDEPQRIDYAKMARVADLVYDVALHTANLDHRVVVDKPKPDPEAPCKQ